MIMHNCIECDYFEMIPLADKCPALQRYECPECDTAQWIRHSRIDPTTYPLEAFDEKTGVLKGYNETTFHANIAR